VYQYFPNGVPMEGKTHLKGWQAPFGDIPETILTLAKEPARIHEGRGPGLSKELPEPEAFSIPAKSGPKIHRRLRDVVRRPAQRRASGERRDLLERRFAWDSRSKVLSPLVLLLRACRFCVVRQPCSRLRACLRSAVEPLAAIAVAAALGRQSFVAEVGQ
jgi:hypothetical protein